MGQNLKTLFINLRENKDMIKHLESKLKYRLPLAIKESLTKERHIRLEKQRRMWGEVSNICEGYYTEVKYSTRGKTFIKTFIGDEKEVRIYLDSLTTILNTPINIIYLKTTNTRETIKEIK